MSSLGARAFAGEGAEMAVAIRSAPVFHSVPR